MAYDNIPIVVVLWEEASFRGRRVVLTEDCPALTACRFLDDTKSIGIHPGPNYDASAEYVVSFYQGQGYTGAQLVLTPGAYPDLTIPYNFANVIQSVKFDQGIPRAPTVSPIPIVAELHIPYNFGHHKLVILEDVADLHTYSDWGDAVSSVKVRKGPNYAPGKKARLYRDRNYRGGWIELDPGDYPDLGASHSFNNVASSIKVR